ncbi:hypothetical protein [Marinomonas foliarum]|uniref:hypothetical protein n=1 Tax=Marinomonas foliarum TaxID=491950 RepID=UPI0011C04B51|nr:hypothetical protein [Marinomonas foliarum]
MSLSLVVEYDIPMRMHCDDLAMFCRSSRENMTPLATEATCVLVCLIGHPNVGVSCEVLRSFPLQTMTFDAVSGGQRCMRQCATTSR